MNKEHILVESDIHEALTKKAEKENSTIIKEADKILREKLEKEIKEKEQKLKKLILQLHKDGVDEDTIKSIKKTAGIE